jgi:hypothetical protein
MTFRQYTNEELINHIDMDMDATQREKELAMRLAMVLDAMAEMETAVTDIVQSAVEQVL